MGLGVDVLQGVCGGGRLGPHGEGYGRVEPLLYAAVHPFQVGRSEDACRKQTRAERHERIAGLPGRHLLGRAVAAHVPLVVAAQSVGLALQQRRALPATGPRYRRGRRAQDVQHIVAVGDQPRHGVRCRPRGDIADRLMFVLRGELAVEVVLAHEDDGKPPQHGQVQRLVERTLVRRPVPEEGHGDTGRGAGQLRPAPQGQCQPNRDGDTAPDDAVRTHDAELQAGDVQRSPFSAVVALATGEELREHLPRVCPSGQDVPVAPVRAGQAILRPQGRADADRHRLLPDVGVEETRDVTGDAQLGSPFLEAPDEPHLRVEPLQESWRIDDERVHRLTLPSARSGRRSARGSPPPPRQSCAKASPRRRECRRTPAGGGGG